ncbi:MAG: HPF/RaiA family ribosome-associated protein [Deltaproteobacteria bacterium]|nr:HPF/RaiA family ribosome-associated protein [Deltaproteobacteria bacterium]
MRLEIRGLKMEVTEALRTHIERRVHFALGRYAASIDRVDVRITDLNASRGGIDKQCRMRATGRPDGAGPGAPAGRPQPGSGVGGRRGR